VTVQPVLRRVGQFWRHSSARVSSAENARATEILGPRLAPFFFALPVNDRRHGLDVLETIEREGVAAPALLQQAALLHDTGKADARLSVVERSLTVFLNRFSPSMLAGLLRIRPGFRRRYQSYRDHAGLGAARLRAVGATELAAVVEEHHAEHPELDVTRRLRRADSRN